MINGPDARFRFLSARRELVGMGAVRSSASMPTPCNARQT
jgi:hypothetical protein